MSEKEMDETFQLEIATPDRLLVRERVTEAEIPAANGYVGILPQHSPLLAALGTGPLWFTTAGGGRKTLVVSGGFLEVQPHHVRVLADRAEQAEEIDLERARRALQRAEERLRNPAEKNIDIARALNAMHRAQARLEAAKQR